MQLPPLIHYAYYFHFKFHLATYVWFFKSALYLSRCKNIAEIIGEIACAAMNKNALKY